VITMYLCFLAGGAVLPILSFLFGSFGNGTDVDVDIGADLDMNADIGVDMETGIDIGTNIDTGADIDVGEGVGNTFSIGLLPTSLMSLSALAITFGAVGGVMSFTGKGKALTFVVAVITGYLASVIIQTILKTLKKAQKESDGINENELMLYDGKVVDTILPGQLGSVSFTTLKKVLVSYPARCSDENLKLETGKIVKVIEINNGIFLVEPKNKYE